MRTAQSRREHDPAKALLSIVLNLSEVTKRQWAQPGFREAVQEYWSAPERRALVSEFMKDMWAQPELRGKRIAAMREGWSPEAREQHAATLRESWSNLSPEEKENRIAIIREAMSSPEIKGKAAASARENWSTRPEDKVKAAARLIARWKTEEGRDAMLKNTIFRRDDNHPKMKMQWDKMKKNAKTFADNLNANKLRAEYHNAFNHLHLDISQYDPKAHQTATLRKTAQARKLPSFTNAQLTQLKERFLDNVLSTGSPEMSSKVFKELAKELQCETRNSFLRVRLNKERRVWLRAAAVLRRKGVDIDYANIPHLAWLEEVGRL